MFVQTVKQRGGLVFGSAVSNQEPKVSTDRWFGGCFSEQEDK